MLRDQMKEILITKYKFQENEFIDMSTYTLKRLYTDYTGMVLKENILARITKEWQRIMASYDTGFVTTEKIKGLRAGVEIGFSQSVKIINEAGIHTTMNKEIAKVIKEYDRKYKRVKSLIKKERDQAYGDTNLYNVLGSIDKFIDEVLSSDNK